MSAGRQCHASLLQLEVGVVSALVEADYAGYQNFTTLEVGKGLSDIIGTDADTLRGLLLASKTTRHSGKTHGEIGDSCFGAELVDLFRRGFELQGRVINRARELDAVDLGARIYLFEHFKVACGLGDDGSPFFVCISSRHAGGGLW